MKTVEQRLDEMETRLRLLEDRAAIFQLMASYGPAVDSMDEAGVARLWTEDGVYDTDAFVFKGAREVGALIHGEGHKAYVAAGSAHVISMPHLVVDGDSAVAIGYSRVYIGDSDGHKVARASANCWEFVRTSGGWKVKRRVNRRLVGTEEPRSLLRPGGAGK